ncbi:hypothetical protein HYE39_02915 [Mycoplasmopsis bovis]|nr:hypothetical protein [Mycoplasmopsis bovis]QQH21140.1 hypothetical protein HYE39_02915 [Mycoplasmopsis bovis]
MNISATSILLLFFKTSEFVKIVLLAPYTSKELIIKYKIITGYRLKKIETDIYDNLIWKIKIYTQKEYYKIII